MNANTFRRRLCAMICAALLCAPVSGLAQDVATHGEAQPLIQAFSLSAAADAIVAEASGASVPAAEAVEQYSVKLIPGEETLDIAVTDATERSIMVSIYDAELQYVDGDTIVGSQTLTYALPAGDYYVIVEYEFRVEGVDAFEAEVTIEAKAEEPDNDSASDSAVTPVIPDNSGASDSGSSADADVQTPFTVSLMAGEETLEATIFGASSHILTVSVLDASNTLVRRAKVEGSQKVSIGDLAAGSYTVRVEYSPSLSGVGAVEAYVEVKPKPTASPSTDPTTPPDVTPTPKPVVTPTPSAPAQTVKSIEAIVKVGKDSIKIFVARGEDLPMVAFVGDQQKTIKLGGSVTFSGLAKGTYDIEIDYKDAVSGNSPFRMTVKVPLEEPDSYILLQKGMECYEVYLLTQRLEQLGYPITARYSYDSDVVTAVRLFQEENKLGVDGIAGKKTQSVLYSSSADDYNLEDDYETLDRHDNGKAAVYALQQRLKDLGYYSIRVDGIYGSGTERAVRWFQKVNGLKETGKADAAMQNLLYSSKAKKASSAYEPDSYDTLSRSKYYNSKVVPLQRRLKELGYLSGSVDGYFGSQTYRAVRSFQSRNGLSATGVADAATQKALYSSSAKAASGSSSSSTTGYRLLYWGCEGTAVKTLQNALINAGYKSIVRVADGIYGQWTYDAVRAYQKDHGLAVDGIAGKNTQNSLYGTNY